MTLPIFVLLSTLASIAGAWTIENDGLIRNFIWPQDSNNLSSLNSSEDVIFDDAYFEDFSRVIGDQLVNMKKLRFDGGTVLQVYLKHNIDELDVSSSKTKHIEIDPNEEYAIVHMTVHFCELTSIPRNIDRLKRLQILSLPSNKIEHVKMSDFNGLNNLEELRLYRNGMKTLSGESTIHLPKLRILSLYSNKLREVHVCPWDMPTLDQLYLDDNKLKFVVNLVDQFPKLSEISIDDNPLVCPWMDNFVRSLKIKNISLKYGDITCNATDETLPPIECPLVYTLSNQLTDLLERQRSFEQSMEESASKMESLEQMVQKSNDENQSLKQTVAALIDLLTMSSKEIISLQQMVKQSNEEGKTFRQSMETFKQHTMGKQNAFEHAITTLAEQLTELRHSIDVLTEVFYRYVLEKEGVGK